MRHNLKGFTLIEILVALFIFTFVAMIMTSALHTVITSQTRTEKQSALFSELQTTLLLLSNDIQQTVARPIINSKQGIDLLKGSTNSLQFTHAGLANPNGTLQRSTLQHTQYTVENNHFIRSTWPMLDQTMQSQPSSRSLLDNIHSVRFEYLDEDGRLQNNWPSPDNKKSLLPRAVKITITINHWGSITQTYVIPVTMTKITTTNSEATT